MVENLPVPDLRFEQSFLARLRLNSTRLRDRKLQNQYETHKKDLLKSASSPQEAVTLNLALDANLKREKQLPAPITIPVIISTIISDQILLPLTQGFFMALFKIVALPWVRGVFGLGRRVGAKLAGRN